MSPAGWSWVGMRARPGHELGRDWCIIGGAGRGWVVPVRAGTGEGRHGWRGGPGDGRQEVAGYPSPEKKSSPMKGNTPPEKNHPILLPPEKNPKAFFSSPENILPESSLHPRESLLGFFLPMMLLACSEGSIV